MGFYSVPAIMVASKLGAVAGTVVLLSNMLREALTIILSPIIVKYLGKPALVAIGGSTSMDVSLAVIREVGGNSLVPLAIINGMILTIVVPLFVSLILSLV